MARVIAAINGKWIATDRPAFTVALSPSKHVLSACTLVEEGAYPRTALWQAQGHGLVMSERTLSSGDANG